MALSRPHYYEAYPVLCAEMNSVDMNHVNSVYALCIVREGILKNSKRSQRNSVTLRTTSATTSVIHWAMFCTDVLGKYCQEESKRSFDTKWCILFYIFTVRHYVWLTRLLVPDSDQSRKRKSRKRRRRALVKKLRIHLEFQYTNRVVYWKCGACSPRLRKNVLCRQEWTLSRGTDLQRFGEWVAVDQCPRVSCYVPLLVYSPQLFGSANAFELEHVRGMPVIASAINCIANYPGAYYCRRAQSGP